MATPGAPPSHTHCPAPRSCQFLLKSSQQSSHFRVSVYLLLCPRVGPRGEGVGEIVVERSESVQEEEIVCMVEGYGRRKISLNCAWL